MWRSFETKGSPRKKSIFHLSVHSSFNKHELNACYMWGVVLGLHIKQEINNRNPCPHRAYIPPLAPSKTMSGLLFCNSFYVILTEKMCFSDENRWCYLQKKWIFHKARVHLPFGKFKRSPLPPPHSPLNSTPRRDRPKRGWGGPPGVKNWKRGAAGKGQVWEWKRERPQGRRKWGTLLWCLRAS